MKFLPFIGALLSLCALAAKKMTLGYFAHQIGALKFAWFYLRFIQRREVGRGDNSEGFAVHTFYPEPIASIVQPFATVAFAIFRPFLSSLQGSVDTNANINGKSAAPSLAPRSTVDPVDAERRRQRALAALDARLGTSNSDVAKVDDSV